MVQPHGIAHQVPMLRVAATFTMLSDSFAMRAFSNGCCCMARHQMEDCGAFKGTIAFQ